jgi:homeodomain-containing protein
VERGRIVLFTASGQQDKEIAAVMAITPKKVSRWRKRFLALGVTGLQKDAHRPGRKPTIGTRLIHHVVTLTTRQTPANATHWSTRTMAAAVGISEASVRRIWRAHGLKPHRVQTFKISNDRAFPEKLEDIVGLYLNPPARAGAVRRREEPNSSSGSYPARFAAETRTRRDHDARLQTQRHRHSVCRAECGQRRSLWPVPGASSAPGAAQVSPPDRPHYPGGSATSLDLR